MKNNYNIYTDIFNSPIYSKKLYFTYFLYLLKSICFIYVIYNLLIALLKLPNANNTHTISVMINNLIDNKNKDLHYSNIIIIIIYFIFKYLEKKIKKNMLEYNKIVEDNVNILQNKLFKEILIFSNNKKEDINYIRSQMKIYTLINIRIINNIFECIYILNKIIVFITIYLIYNILDLNQTLSLTLKDIILNIIYVCLYILIIPFIIYIALNNKYIYKNSEIYQNINIFKNSRFYDKKNYNNINIKTDLNNTYANDIYITSDIMYNININSINIFNILISIFIIVIHTPNTEIINMIFVINMIFYNASKYLLYIGYDINELKQYKFNFNFKIDYLNDGFFGVKYNNNYYTYKVDDLSSYNKNINFNNIVVLYNYVENVDLTIQDLITITNSDITIHQIIYQLVKNNKYYIPIDINMYITDKKIPKSQSKDILNIIYNNIQNSNIIDNGSNIDIKLTNNNIYRRV